MARTTKARQSWWPFPWPWTPSPTPNPLPVNYGGLVDSINRARVANGKHILKKDPKLTDIAVQWAACMAFNQKLDHGDFAGRIATVYPNVAAGEDIAVSATLDDVINLWMNSAPHKEQILGDYTIVGTGKSKGADGSVYWCIDFA